MVLVSDPGVVTGWPSTVVTTSPLTRPALAAGVLQSTPSTSAPWAAGAMVAGTEGSELSVTQPAPGPPGPWPLPAPGPLPCWDCCCSCWRCWEACFCGLLLLLWGTSTPRKPGTPICTVPPC